MNMRKLFNPLKNMRFLFIILFVLSPLITRADASAVPSTAPSVGPISIFVFIVLGFVILAVLFLLYTLRLLYKQIRPAVKEEPLFEGIIKKLTDTVPVEKEEAILTDHIYDGIRELDNNLPPWWKYLFYATIVFSGIYLYAYHFN